VAELNGRNVSYGYDNDYRLQSETITGDTGGNNGAENYTCNFVGNHKTLTSTIPSLPGSVSYSYDANDRLITDTYDNYGNPIVSLGVTNTYDFEDHMLTHGAVRMVYDGDGNRVSETVGGVTTTYLVDTLNPTNLHALRATDIGISDGIIKRLPIGRYGLSKSTLPLYPRPGECSYPTGIGDQL
jgi:YD repeat-containing protein